MNLLNSNDSMIAIYIFSYVTKISSLPEVVFVPDAVLADPGRDEAGWRHIKGRVPHTEAVTQLEAREEFSRRPLLDRDVASIRTVPIQSGHGHADVKRNPEHNQS